MQIYCGTDIIEVARIEDAVENTKGFKENIYTKNEIKEIDKIRSKMKYQRYAGRFAAKEAIYKALSKVTIENQININYLDVEVINQSELLGRPKVCILNKKLQRLFEEKDIEIDVSISHINECAISTAIVKVNKE